ncbi:hypothetical protein W02_00450 [Nitrospira sp. KM1]|uniref:pilus assembly FimT family protein n=1 Tax=Nitrospira sp. KM1 TaxID=1936990 RepID=UPI0013A7629A|nr:type II secretion system protein [Nitrospira sp. KM1]BCA52905.1 hypothetical protein W02_00450 [Nitrospira sp. KM1]
MESPTKNTLFRDSRGFTLLEIIIVLFLLGGMLSIIIPRIGASGNLGAAGRKFIALFRTLQDLSMSQQKTVRLYLDLDRGQYWPMLIDGNQEKIPLDPEPMWQKPFDFPDAIRIADLQVGQTKSSAGRVDVYFYPNGRIDPAILHLVNDDNHVLGFRVDPVSSDISLTDQRIEPPKPWIIPERVKPLLQIQQSLPGMRQNNPLGQR